MADPSPSNEISTAPGSQQQPPLPQDKLLHQQTSQTSADQQGSNMDAASTSQTSEAIQGPVNSANQAGQQQPSASTSTVPTSIFCGLISSSRGIQDAPENESQQQKKGQITVYPEPIKLAKLQIDRRGGVPPLTVPRAPLPNTKTQHEDRLITLRNVVQIPTTKEELEELLHENRWDINMSALNFGQQAEAAGREVIVGKARVAAIHSLYERINGDVAEEDKVHHRITQIIFLLDFCRWDIEEAYKTHTDALSGDLSRFEQDIANLRPRHPDQIEADRRLAQFITLTASDNWYWARAALTSHKWDTARALDAWYLAGAAIPQVEVSKKIKDGGFRVFRAPQATVGDDAASVTASELSLSSSEDSDTLKSPEQNIFPASTFSASTNDESSSLDEDQALSEISAHSSDSPMDDWSPVSSLSSSSSESAGADNAIDKKGSIIDPNNGLAKRYCPDPTKLVVEKIVEGTYRCYLFDKLDRETAKAYRFNDSDHSSDHEKIELNWNESQPITQVNNWRNQIYRRGGQIVPVRRREPFVPEELEYLWLLHAQHLEEVTEGDPDYFNNGGDVPLHVSVGRLQAWTDQFNARFAGQTHVDGHRISANQRPTRTTGSIEAQRHRINSVIRDFQIPQNVAHPYIAKTKTGRGRKTVKKQAPGTTVNDGDSGKSDAGGGNLVENVEDDNEAAFESKKRKTHDEEEEAEAGPSKKPRTTDQTETPAVASSSVEVSEHQFEEMFAIDADIEDNGEDSAMDSE